MVRDRALSFASQGLCHSPRDELPLKPRERAVFPRSSEESEGSFVAKSRRDARRRSLPGERSSRSTAPPFRRGSSPRSCSATRRAPSRAAWNGAVAGAAGSASSARVDACEPRRCGDWRCSVHRGMLGLLPRPGPRKGCAPASRNTDLRPENAIPCVAREAESEVSPPGAVVLHVVPSDVPEVAAPPPREVDAEVDPLLDHVAEEKRDWLTKRMSAQAAATGSRPRTKRNRSASGARASFGSRASASPAQAVPHGEAAHERGGQDAQVVPRTAEARDDVDPDGGVADHGAEALHVPLRHRSPLGQHRGEPAGPARLRTAGRARPRDSRRRRARLSGRRRSSQPPGRRGRLWRRSWWC